MKTLHPTIILLCSFCFFWAGGCVAQSQYDQAVARATQTSHELASIKAQRDELQQQDSQLHARIAALEASIKDTSDKLTDSRKKQYDTNEELVKTKLDLAQSRKETEDAQRLGDAQKQVVELMSKLAAQQAEISKLEKDKTSEGNK